MTNHPEISPAQFTRLYAQPVEAAENTSSETVCSSPCEACGGQNAREIFTLPGTRFTTLRCDQCGLGSLHPAPTPEEIASFYPPTYYGGDGRKFSPFVESIVRWIGARHARFLSRAIKSGGKVLDIGCGRGVTLRALADVGLETHGFEVSDSAAQGLDARVQLRVAPSLQAAAYDREFFDGILLWHVLEHIPNPRVTLEEINRLLKPGGAFVVAVPNFSSWQSIWAGPDWFHLDPPRHLFHFSLPALQRLLAETGFDCLSTHHFSLRQNPFGWIQSLLNKCRWLPRNSLYMLLHRRGTSATRYSWLVQMQLYFACGLLLPAALGLSVLAAAARRGATVHIVARKR